MKVWDCLPDEISARLRECSDVREIRIRDGRHVRVNIGNRWYILGKKEFILHGAEGIVSSQCCDDIVRRACNNSVYAYEKMLAKGFFTLDDGVRIGVCGDVSASDEPVFRKYTSLCFRIPHYIGIADSDVMDCCQKGNVVVVGPPCSGKTTMLRDIAVKLSEKYNVLVADERGELFYDEKLHHNCDVLKWAKKNYTFDVGVRSMSPDWIVCDELALDDISSIKYVASSGVKIACSVHGKNVSELERKFGITDIFATAIVLGTAGTKRIVEHTNRPPDNIKK